MGDDLVRFFNVRSKAYVELPHGSLERVSYILKNRERYAVRGRDPSDGSSLTKYVSRTEWESEAYADIRVVEPASTTRKRHDMVERRRHLDRLEVVMRGGVVGVGGGGGGSTSLVTTMTTATTTPPEPTTTATTRRVVVATENSNRPGVTSMTSSPPPPSSHVTVAPRGRGGRGRRGRGRGQ